MSNESSDVRFDNGEDVVEVTENFDGGGDTEAYSYSGAWVGNEFKESGYGGSFKEIEDEDSVELVDTGGDSGDRDTGNLVPRNKLTPQAQDALLEKVYGAASTFIGEQIKIEDTLGTIDSYLFSPAQLSTMSVKELISARKALHAQRMDYVNFIRKVLMDNPVVRYGDEKNAGLLHRLEQVPPSVLEKVLDSLDDSE